MMRHAFHRRVVVFVSGSLFGVVAYAILGAGGVWPIAHAQESPAENSTDLTALQRDVEMLKGKAPSQSHSMIDVDYHFTNLWFAAKSRNWPLADF